MLTSLLGIHWMLNTTTATNINGGEHDMKTVTVELKHQEHDILAQKVEDYFGGWHPFAYGTRLVRPAYYDEDQQCWVAVISRQTSCD